MVDISKMSLSEREQMIKGLQIYLLYDNSRTSEDYIVYKEICHQAQKANFSKYNVQKCVNYFNAIKQLRSIK